MIELELAAVFLLILMNGAFALSELALVSARARRLQAMADAGRAGAASALALTKHPGRFLSTVQIGITLVGILAGAFSGETLGIRLAATLQEWGVPENVADPLGFGLVVVCVTYLSIVIGELVPKRFALRNPEGIACVMAPLMGVISRIAAPAVWLLDASTTVVFWLLRVGPEQPNVVTDEEIRAFIAEAEGAGTIEPAERHLISGVMRLGDRPVRAVMTPRHEIDWLDLAADVVEVREKLIATQHSRLPVGEGSYDALIGVVQSKDLLARIMIDGSVDVRAHITAVPTIPDTASALGALAMLREAKVPLALVYDEYGHFEGLITPADLLESITGVFRAEAEEPGAVCREDGSWLLAGWLPADEMAEHLQIPLPPERDYQTAAGYVLSVFRRIPSTGEYVAAAG
ncbi:MAG: HlyC/CorC family transporter, partial [Proteobacteria bacterium]|nr:HlyC/CorC family transporter [Pseudomonadota bacterium]